MAAIVNIAVFKFSYMSLNHISWMADMSALHLHLFKPVVKLNKAYSDITAVYH